MRIAFRYDELDTKVWDLVSGLEKKQSNEKVGLYGKGVEPGTEPKDDLREKFEYSVRDKHGKIKLPQRRNRTEQ